MEPDIANQSMVVPFAEIWTFGALPNLENAESLVSPPLASK